MSERSPSPSGAGPFRLSLEQQKKRAKELLAGVRAGDADALTRWTRHRPDGAAPCLATAQHVIARELGLPSWPRLKAHVEAMDRARRAMGQGDALDGDCRTLHIRCGSDIRGRLRNAGLTGDFLEYSNPFCQGPVTDGPDFLDRRAAFLAASYGTALGVSAADLRARLEREEAGLAAANTYDRVVLWFEHDGYDQLILARCLERFAVLGPPPELEMVSLNHFPGGARFIGLGQLPPEALRLLWAKRRAVSWADCRAGREVWHALTAPEPDGLAALLRQGFGGQRPIMAAAVRRHLQELPGTADGLGLTQRLVLTALAERECTAGGVWRELMRETDPLPFLTDLMLWDIVGGLLGAADPAVIADAAGATPWPARRLALTGTGRDVLAGRRDWLSCGPAERWVGGVPIRPGAPVWRWDDAADAVRCY